MRKLGFSGKSKTVRVTLKDGLDIQEGSDVLGEATDRPPDPDSYE